MKLAKAVDSVGTITELKRIASAYVIDYRGLSEAEIKEACKKTAPQYYFQENVSTALNDLFFCDSRSWRILSGLILKNLLQKDDFMCPTRDTDDDVITFQQSIVNRSNEDLLKKTPERSKDLELFHFVLETAWAHNQSISPDEKNLIEKLRLRLRITVSEMYLIEAKLSKFPKIDNELHTREEIEDARRALQSKGLLFAVRDSDNTNFDVIPEEVAQTIRLLLGIEMREHGYRAMIATKYVRSKPYMLGIMKKCGAAPGRATTIEELQETVIEQIKPSAFLGGVSPRDGLDITDLRKWCNDIGVNVSGVKADLIQRIIQHYDVLLERDQEAGDERAIWYEHIEKFAERDLEFLRKQQFIQKDINCEKRFEEATNYLFENKLKHKPLQLVGTAHSDGALSYQDKIIFWDNKSKESAVNLQHHIKQFDGYIKDAEKPVACFIVIAPDFTPESSSVAMQYQVQNQVTICLITASELKSVAESWCRQKDGPFPLGYLIQPGRFNPALLPI